jgi:hypothetical protein
VARAAVGAAAPGAAVAAAGGPAGATYGCLPSRCIFEYVGSAAPAKRVRRIWPWLPTLIN